MLTTTLPRSGKIKDPRTNGDYRRDPANESDRQMRETEPRNDQRKVAFQVTAAPGAKVFLAGTFNNWSPKQKRMKAENDSGLYKTVLMLPPGRYEYKFIVDGEWRIDGRNPQWKPNGVGSLNSVLEVR